MNDQTTTTNSQTTNHDISLLEDVLVQIAGVSPYVFHKGTTLTRVSTTDESIAKWYCYQLYQNDQPIHTMLSDRLEQIYNSTVESEVFMTDYIAPFVDKPTITATQFNGLTGNDKTQYELSLKFLTEEERDQVKDFVEMMYQSKLRAFEKNGELVSCLHAVYFEEETADQTKTDNSFGEELLPPQE